ncbi:MAG TPA: type II toxin-antitoxin system VapC family toxin [Thermoanaerobaculia bacterium]|nr:type II toxin-antitoxin system VapC family toxin [Thermoanaerobaculia bacterium]
MIPFAYLDSSVLLRRLFAQEGMLAEWAEIERGVVSALVEVECLRTIDRLRRSSPPDDLSDHDLAIHREAVFRLLHTLEIVEVTRPVLSRAAQPMPTLLGTLDAIHLATELLWQEETGAELLLATHDVALGRAARASGLSVIGL